LADVLKLPLGQNVVAFGHLLIKGWALRINDGPQSRAITGPGQADNPIIIILLELDLRDRLATMLELKGMQKRILAFRAEGLKAVASSAAP